MITLIAELAFIIAEVVLVKRDMNKVTVDIFQVLDLIFSAYYCVEVLLRIIGNGSVNLFTGI